MFSLESPHRGDSNENRQYIIFNIKRKITLNYPQSAAMGFFPSDSSTSSKQASVFEPLKFYCTWGIQSDPSTYCSTEGKIKGVHFGKLNLRIMKYKAGFSYVLCSEIHR